VAFHVWLLATQWQAGRLTEPGLLLRWAAAIGIALSLRALYRSGIPALSRKSVVIWLLAALLHGPAVASRTGDSINLNAIPEAAVTFVLQAAAVAGALSVTLLLLAGVLGRRLLPAPRAWAFVSSFGLHLSLADGFSAVVSARPPPARA
jgi:hypothetical protein